MNVYTDEIARRVYADEIDQFVLAAGYERNDELADAVATRVRVFCMTWTEPKKFGDDLKAYAAALEELECVASKLSTDATRALGHFASHSVTDTQVEARRVRDLIEDFMLPETKPTEDRTRSFVYSLTRLFWRFDTGAEHGRKTRALRAIVALANAVDPNALNSIDAARKYAPSSTELKAEFPPAK